MAVSSNLTSLADLETSPSFTNIGSGGGASQNSDVFIEGSFSGGRRVDSATDKGFMVDFTSTDLSAANEHLKIWVYCFHWSQVTALAARIASGTTAYDNHVYPAADIPFLGGWIPLWVDVSRTPDSTGTSGANEAAVIDAGAYISIANVGGAGDNFIIDEILHGTSGLTWSGSGGAFDDFRTYEATNVQGVLVPSYGADLCFARLELSDTAATTFTDEGFTIVFPDQALVSTTFMGLTADLSNASTSVSLTNGALVSGDPVAAARRPDFLASGTSGTLTMDTMLLNGLRTVELTSACSLTNSVVLNTGVVDASVAGTTGADLSGSTFADSIVAADASAVVWDVNDDTDGPLDNTTFIKGTAAHHALELGTNSPTTVTLNNVTFTGFNASDGQNDSTIYVARPTGTVTINISGGTTPSIKTAGATVVVNAGVTVQVTAATADGTPVGSARVLLRASNGTGPFPFEESVSISNAGTTATVTHTSHGLATNDKVNIEGASHWQNNGVFSITVTGANTYTYTLPSDPGSSPTGTIISTFVALEGLTNGSGIATANRTYPSNQPVSGWARKSTSSPRYKTAPINGTVSSTTGATLNAVMILDE